MKQFFVLLLSAISLTAFSQQNVGIGTTTPNASAQLDVSSTNKGLLVPRLTQAQRNAITTPATGLMIYQTDNTPGFYYYNGSAWSAFSSGTGSFTLPYYSTFAGALVGSRTAMQVDLLPPSFSFNNYAFVTEVNSTTGTGFYGKANIGGAVAARFTTGSGSPVTPFYALVTDTGSNILNLYSGNTGIGAAPAYKLDVNGRMRIRHSTVTSGVWFNKSDNTEGAFVGMINDSTAGFWGNATSGNWRMAVDVKNAMVGIGTSLPTAPLSFASSLGNKIALWGDATTAHYGIGIQGALMQFYTDNSNSDIAFGYGRSDQGFFTERMRIKGNGNVGIGTSSPDNTLTVSGNGIGFSQQSVDAGTKIGFYTIAGSAYLQTHTNHDINFATNNGSSQMILKTSGNVGIGTTTPAYKLDVSGGASSQTLNVSSNVSGLGALATFNNSGNGINGFFNGGSYGLYVSGATSVGINVDPVTNAEQAIVINKGRLKFKGNMTNGFAHGVTYTNNAGTADRSFIGMYDDNQMGLYGFAGAGWGMLYNVTTGQINLGASRYATGYKLNVGGKIMAEEIRVQLQAAWPDYVFSDNYKLMPLPELDSFISTNKHLPGIKPAAEVEKEGADLGESQRKLTEKVEELTLYILELKKEIDVLKNEQVNNRSLNSH